MRIHTSKASPFDEIPASEGPTPHSGLSQLEIATFVLNSGEAKNEERPVKCGVCLGYDTSILKLLTALPLSTI